MSATRKTIVSIEGDQFRINGEPTYPGRYWNGHRIEGLLLNSRMVQGIFDDSNPATRPCFAYPDTGTWDPERNTREFVSAMEEWRAHGLLAFTLNLQGGSPRGYGNKGWINPAFNPDGSLDPAYRDRLVHILNRADELGMVVILGLFYFGQDQHLKDEAAVVRAVDTATRWILENGYTNVIVETNNECDIHYTHDILKSARVHELILQVRATAVEGKRLLAGASYSGGHIPDDAVIEASDLILLHGNGVGQPARIAEMVDIVRANPAYCGQPIVFNEDDHFDFDKDDNNMLAAISAGASWGFFDYRMEHEPFECGYQSVPVHWGIDSDRKRGFFNKVREITGPDTTGR